MTLPKPARKLKIFVNCIEGIGHMNACISLSQTLTERGHDVVFVVNESLVKQIEKAGFRTIALVQKDENNDNEDQFAFSEDPAKDFASFLEKAELFTNRSSLEKMKSFTDDVDNGLMAGTIKLMIQFNPQIERILAEEKPDLWIYDHVILPPACRNIPHVLLCSAAPLTYYHSPVLPPGNSGYPLADKSEWSKFGYERVRKLLGRYQSKVDAHFGLESDPETFWRSKYLNIHQYPLELDYQDVEGFIVPETFIGVDVFDRKEPEPFQLPEEFLARQTGSDKLIYFSLGSMGSYDIDVVQKITTALSKLPYKVIVSKGSRGDEYELPANCWGENFLPQPEIVKIVDLVITHGGNNTFCEAFAQGKKMIVMPVFGDQFDNAQRIHETGYGLRLNLYDFNEQQLIDAVEKLINDQELEERLKAVKKRIATSNRREEAVRRIEKLICSTST